MEHGSAEGHTNEPDPKQSPVCSPVLCEHCDQQD